MREAKNRGSKANVGAESVKFHVKIKEQRRWRSFTTVVAYYSNLPEGKDMSCVKHGPSAQNSFCSSWKA